MASEEDNFDIDIYGDGGGEDYHDEDGQVDDRDQMEHEQQTDYPEKEQTSARRDVDTGAGADESPPHSEQPHHPPLQEVASGSAEQPQYVPREGSQVQGLKRKEGVDDIQLDPGATNAILIAELPWWITDDDLRGWANQAGWEDELQELTFSEHKVNGKSKGQAYVLFQGAAAATSVKRTMENSGSEGQGSRPRFQITYTNPYTNPFRTYPKEGPMRNGNQGNRAPSSGFSNAPNMSGPQSGFNPGGSFRGGRGGYNNRGMNPSGFNNRGGFGQQPVPGSWNQNSFNMNSMQQPYNSFNNRGNMMGGMRGSNVGMRGGRGGSPMMGMPMANMPMGGMPAMGIPNMGGMQGNPHSSYPHSYAQPHGAPQIQTAPTGYAYALASTCALPQAPETASVGKMARPRARSGTVSVEATHPAHTGSALCRQSLSPAVPAPSLHHTQPSQIYSPAPSGLYQAQSYHPATHLFTQPAPVYPYSHHYDTGGAFYGGQPSPGSGFFGPGMADSSWNPHGAKRTRQE